MPVPHGRSTWTLGSALPVSLHLLTARELGDAAITYSADPTGSLRIAALCRDIGDIVTSFENSEVTVFIGDFTHRHFTPPSTTTSDAGRCVADAVQLIRGVLEERYVLWRYPNGVGGCYLKGSDPDLDPGAPLANSGAVYFFWSGTILCAT
jgi:hypothetical protein